MFTEKDIYLYFQKKALNSNSLFQVEIDVCKSCNANCIFCFQGEHKVDKNTLTLDELKKVMNDLRKMGVYSIGFSGGEPFSRKDFIEILKYARKLHFRISIITNAMLLNKNIIDQLNDIFIERITISFHSINKNTYNYLFGINDDNYFNKVIDNIRYMISLKMNIGIAVTITKYNVNELLDIQNFFNEMGISRVNINFNSLLQGKKEINNILPNKVELEKQSNVFKEKDKIFLSCKEDEIRCIAGRSSCSIDPFGNVYPCTFFNTAAGNVKETPIKEIWENSHLLKIIRAITKNHFEKCNNCELSNKCSVCICDNLNRTGNLFYPDEKYCESKRIRIKHV